MEKAEEILKSNGKARKNPHETTQMLKHGETLVQKPMEMWKNGGENIGNHKNKILMHNHQKGKTIELGSPEKVATNSLSMNN